jgi:sugar lactone lactonase YvrE
MVAHLSIVTSVLPDLPEPDHKPILVRADPSSLLFDRCTQALYVADAYAGAVIRVVGETQRRLATIDSGGVIATNRIGGIALAPDGTVFASRIGYGQAGAIVRITDGHATPLPKLPARPWRGDVVFADDRLYATQYLRSSSGPFEGSIVEVDPVTGACSQVIDGFLHPTGLVKLGSILVVADARQRAVFRVTVSGGRGVLRLQLAGDVDRPESLCAVDADSVLVTTFDDHTGRGAVRRIWLDGRIKTIAYGPWEPRGVATDGDRVFVATRRTGHVLVFPLIF